MTTGQTEEMNEPRVRGANPRPVALVTGVSRAEGIGLAIAERLSGDGFDVACCGWGRYDQRVHQSSGDVAALLDERCSRDGRHLFIEADLEDAASIPALFDEVKSRLGPVSVLVMAHCESVDSGLLDTTVESFDRHFAVNARASWLLIREFGFRVPATAGHGRVIALTSDHVVGNLPYGASKAALDAITLAAARELAGRGVTANVINPGPTDTGWMDPEMIERVAAATPLGRAGRPSDVAHLVSFLCSPEGGWINGQLLHSNGGLAEL